MVQDVRNASPAAKLRLVMYYVQFDLINLKVS